MRISSNEAKRVDVLTGLCICPQQDSPIHGTGLERVSIQEKQVVNSENSALSSVCLLLSSVSPATTAVAPETPFVSKVVPSGDSPPSFLESPLSLQIPNDSSLKQSPELFACDFPGCIKAFTELSIFQNHVRTHTTAQAAAQAEAAASSGLVQTMSGPLKCPHPGCNRLYSSRPSLLRHSVTHGNVKGHDCHCGMSFFFQSQLKRHQRVHTGERPYKCTVSGCGKAFTRSDDLKNHTVKHTGERRYVCRVCELSFTQSSSLRRHSVKKHGQE